MFPAGFKLLVLVVAGAGLIALRHIGGLALIFLISVCLVWMTGISAKAVWRQVKGLCWLLLMLGLVTAYFQGKLAAVEVLLRVASMVGLALAVTVSTRVSALISVCERVLLPLERLGLLEASKVALALALALRFIPDIWRNFQEIREAQAARGLGTHPLALVVPLLVLTLRRAQEVAEAIDARSL